MRALIPILGVFCAGLSVSATADSTKPPYDLDRVAKHVAGDYVVVGRQPESDATYTGCMSFRQNGKDLEFTRIFGSDTQHGSVLFDTKADEGGRPVLRIRFSIDGQPYEAMYLWGSDLSNFARLTGYVYSTAQGKTKLPGLEALFPIIDYYRSDPDGGLTRRCSQPLTDQKNAK